MPILTSLDDVRRTLAEATTIAVLGAHHDRPRPAFYVPDYLHAMGYRVLPVNPTLAGTTLFGETVVASLADLPVDVDIDLVDIFRPASALPGHLPELLALGARAASLQEASGAGQRRHAVREDARGETDATAPDAQRTRKLPTVWFQLGIVHGEVAAALAAAGFDVIQDRCTYADHRLFQLPRISPISRPILDPRDRRP
jgi:hypothetical protein